MYLRSASPSASFVTPFTTRKMNQFRIFLGCALMASVCVFGQDSTTSNPDPPPASDQSGKITVPAGTRLGVVLTQPIQSRTVRRGDDMYAQIASPVTSGDQMVIPPGTFVQGTIENIGRNGSRAELHLQSMAITFPDGYVTPVPGPIVLQTNEGYALKDPGTRRGMSALILPQPAPAWVHSLGTQSARPTPRLPALSLPDASALRHSARPQLRRSSERKPRMPSSVRESEVPWERLRPLESFSARNITSSTRVRLLR